MIKRVYKYCVKHKWEIGFVKNSIEEVLAGQKLEVWWVKHDYKDRWFADPFILSVDSNYITLLVEEFYDPINLGRIAKLVIDKGSHRIISNQLVLQLDTHLSFPAIIRNQGNIYIYPENYQSGVLKLYKYNPETNDCHLQEVLCEEPLTDAIIQNVNGNDFIFSTKVDNPNGRTLGIYKKNSKNKYERFDTLTFEENIARMAGDFFMVGSNLYRPAQESNDSYGHSVSLQKVICDKEKFIINEVVRIPSPHKIHKLGFHTFNIYGDTIVVDVKGFRRPLLGNIGYFLKRLVGLE